MSDCACWMDTLGLRRATIVLPPKRLLTCVGPNSSGETKSICGEREAVGTFGSRKSRKSGGRTPIIVVGTWLSNTFFPTIDASEPNRWRHIAWLVLVIADAGLLAWGAGAAAIPEHLLGPGGTAILPAGYHGYSGDSWHQLASRSPETAGYITLVFRTYGIYIVAFSLLAVAIAATAFRRGERWAWSALLVGNTVAYGSAMTYDRIVGAIGPFEWSEYLGLALIYGSLAVTAPFPTGRRAALSGAASATAGIDERRGSSHVRSPQS